jgi:hypothetical protein
MATRVFLCPNTGQRVQDWFADSENGGDTYEGVTCSACGQVHMVNPKTGKVLGADEETDDPLRDVKKGPALLLEARIDGL